MRSKFDEQLKKLNEEMMHMGSMIEESIQKAIEHLYIRMPIAPKPSWRRFGDRQRAEKDREPVL